MGNDRTALATEVYLSKGKKKRESKEGRGKIMEYRKLEIGKRTIAKAGRGIKE